MIMIIIIITTIILAPYLRLFNTANSDKNNVKTK